MRSPGEVYFLPPDEREEGDPKARRHLLLTTHKTPGDPLVFAFAGTQGTEASFGASHYVLDPFATTYRSTGFDTATYIYPSRLVPAAESDLLRFMGRVLDDMPHIRDALRGAVGLNTGAALGNRDAAGSWRGCVFEFGSDLADECGATHGLVVSEPLYSRRERYQNVVPVLDANEFEPDQLDVLVDQFPWTADITGVPASVILAVPMIFSASHPAELVQGRVAVVDDAVMAEVDLALTLPFDL